MLTSFLAACILGQGNYAPSAEKPKGFYDFAVRDIDGKKVKLGKFKGQVLLVVNVASKCGLTPQYAGLESLYQKYKDKKFAILGFPANDFNGQEPGAEKDIKEFCTGTYGVTFPMFSKIHVKGPETAPLYKWLLSNADRHEDVEWNFAKFLVDRKGKAVGRFAPGVKPDDDGLAKAIEKALDGK